MERTETPVAPAEPPGPGASVGRDFVVEASVAPGVEVVTEDVAKAVEWFSGSVLFGRHGDRFAVAGSDVLV